MTFSVVCAEAMASKKVALVLDCGDEAQQVQERKNEGAKNLPAGTAVIKVLALTAGGQQGILFLNGFKSFTSPTPTNPQETFKWYCCATSDYKFVTPLAFEGKSHSLTNKHLNDTHSVVGQQPDTAVALQTHDALRLVVESEETGPDPESNSSPQFCCSSQLVDYLYMLNHLISEVLQMSLSRLRMPDGMWLKFIYPLSIPSVEF